MLFMRVVRFWFFLNDDTECIQPEWIDRLVMYTQIDGVGAVGALLRYGDHGVQHAGIWCNGGNAFHRYSGYPESHPGYMSALRTAQNCLAVTGACLGITRSRFDEVGGFSPGFPLNFNDVDLCLKLVDAGYRNVVDCQTVVVHHESATREPGLLAGEQELLERRWKRFLHNDPYHNPNHFAYGADELPFPADGLVQSLEALGENRHLPRFWPLDNTSAARARLSSLDR